MKVKQWGIAASMRALKTMAQTAVALIGSNAVSVTQLDWLGILGVSATTGIVSILTSLAGIPEVDGGVSPLGKHAKDEDDG